MKKAFVLWTRSLQIFNHYSVMKMTVPLLSCIYFNRLIMVWRTHWWIYAAWKSLCSMKTQFFFEHNCVFISVMYSLSLSMNWLIVVLIRYFFKGYRVYFMKLFLCIGAVVFCYVLWINFYYVLYAGLKRSFNFFFIFNFTGLV